MGTGRGRKKVLGTAISGTYPMLYAFFNAAGALRRDAFAAQIEAGIAAGAAGIAVLGLGTETGKLTRAERRQVVDWTLQIIAGRVPLAVTVADPNVLEMIESARAAAAAGAAWLILQPPRPPVSPSELIRYFGAVAEQVTVPVAIQNAPEFLGVGLTAGQLLDLNRIQPNVSIVKAEGSALGVGQLIDALEGRMQVFNGRGGLELTDNFRAGVDGMIPGSETIDMQVGVEKAMRAGDEAAAEALYAKFLPFIGFAMQGLESFLCYGKLLAALRLGLEPSVPRLPSAPLLARGQDWTRRHAARFGPLSH